MLGFRCVNNYGQCRRNQHFIVVVRGEKRKRMIEEVGQGSKVITRRLEYTNDKMPILEREGEVEEYIQIEQQPLILN